MNYFNLYIFGLTNLKVSATMLPKTHTAVLFIFLLFSCLVMGQEYKTLTSEGKLKKGRNLLSGVVATIPSGSQVEIIYNSYENGYYRVIYDIWTGYLHEKHFATTAQPSPGINSTNTTVLFSEDFNNNRNNWRESHDPNKDFYFRNGSYHIVQKEEGRLTWHSIPVGIENRSDFVIETVVTLNWKEGGGAHLMYGMNEKSKSYYSVQIKKEKDKKEIFIGKYENRQWYGIWKDANLNYGKPIKVQIAKKGNMISFYINGLFTYSQPFETFYGNAVALGCEGIQHSSFEYLNVYQGANNFTPEVPVEQGDVEVTTYTPVSQVQLVRNKGYYEIPVELNGALKVYSLFEEGASDITISPDVALTLVKSGTITDRNWLTGPQFDFADGTVARSERFRLNSVKIGTKIISDVTCSISGYMEVPMILGKNVLSRMGNYTINAKTGTLTIQ
jgi:predicted aspartyl protease